MIKYIKGYYAMTFSGGIVVETPSGIGFEINIPAGSPLYKYGEGEEITVFTAMIVKEDDISLYGFHNRESLDLFRMLITVSGIGAKGAMSIMGSMSADLVLMGIPFVVAGKSRIGLSVVPKTLSWHYVVMEVIFAIGVWGNSPQSLQSALVLIYAGVITPVFEEMLFRGYIWNRIHQVCSNRWIVYVIVTVLFGIWHIAYTDSIAYRISDGLYSIMIWKVITGMCFGVLLGAVRMKSDNCFATMLVHGTWNLFTR